jgi:hypothetical protein
VACVPLPSPHTLSHAFLCDCVCVCAAHSKAIHTSTIQTLGVSPVMEPVASPTHAMQGLDELENELLALKGAKGLPSGVSLLSVASPNHKQHLQQQQAISVATATVVAAEAAAEAAAAEEAAKRMCTPHTHTHTHTHTHLHANSLAYAQLCCVVLCCVDMTCDLCVTVQRLCRSAM